MNTNNTQYKNKHKNTYSSKQNWKKNDDNDAYHNCYKTTVTAVCFSSSCLVVNLSLSESFRLHATQTTVPLLRSSSFELLLLQ